MLHLVIPVRADVERDAVAAVWAERGGLVTRLDRFWSPPPLPREAVRLYGPDVFSMLVAQRLDLALVSPADDLIVSVPRSLLLIEDEMQVRDFMTQALTAFGYTVTAVGSITAARQRLSAAHSFELVVSDVILPDGTGPSLVRSLLTEQPALPVLLISGHTGNTIEEHFPDIEPPPLLRKPFTLAQLFEALQEVAGR